MRRREFIALAGGAVAWPLVARAQSRPMPVIGFLGSKSPDLWASRVQAFRKGLSEAGFVEGQNVAIEFRWAEAHYERLPALVAELVARKVSVLVTNGPSARAAKAATTTIPIVFQTGVDPVVTGLVASLNKPGGNLTGVTGLTGELAPKRLELLRELVPGVTIASLLVNPDNVAGAAAQAKDAEAAARTLGLQLHVLNATDERDFEKIFAGISAMRAGGLVITADALFNTRIEMLAALALRYNMPAIFQYREFVAAGGFVSYGGSLTELSRQVGLQTGRILKGEKPTDLPVQQATKVELMINLKTAKALGVTVPLSLLGRADEVIE